MVRDVTSFTTSARHLARNPLGIIALFIVLVYAFASLVVGFSNKLTSTERLPIIWFLILFPGLVLFIFAWLVSCHHAKLYAPADYRQDSAFIEASIEQVQVAAAVGAATARKSPINRSSEELASETGVAAGRVAKLITPSMLRAASARRVLWVDDHHRKNSFERSALEALGFQIRLAQTTDEALSIARHEPFDVVISDMNRPAEPRAGLALLDRLRSHGLDTPYIIYSAPVASDQQAEAWKRGALGITGKPDDLVLMVLESVSSSTPPRRTGLFAVAKERARPRDRSAAIA
jgi:CheY-like chemotaxis protein